MRGEAQRGSKQIRAAARDDQVTAERNGLKKDWRRERLATLLDKLEEEVLEFIKDVMECNREGIRWEGSDVRWTVTMIQDHHGVLEEALKEEEWWKSGANFRWCWPRFNVYVPASDALPADRLRLPRVFLNRYPYNVIGAEVVAFGRCWGIQWKRS